VTVSVTGDWVFPTVVYGKRVVLTGLPLPPSLSTAVAATANTVTTSSSSVAVVTGLSVSVASTAVVVTTGNENEDEGDALAVVLNVCGGSSVPAVVVLLLSAYLWAQKEMMELIIIRACVYILQM